MPLLVAVVADVRTADGYTWHAAAQTYLDALALVAGLQPVIVPSLASFEAGGLLARVDGLLSTGSRSNVHPARYGAAETEAHGPFDEARDAVSLALLRGAVERGLPTLALCRGFQEMVVAWGGTLTPALHEEPGRFDHRAPVSTDQAVRFALAHEITVAPGGRLEAIAGPGPHMVNSLHRQGAVTLGTGLRVEATAADGTVEAVSVADADAFAMGFQWHPEYWAATDPLSRTLFEAFGDAVRLRAG